MASLPIDLSALAIEPWQVQGTTNKATLNTQNIFMMGGVAIGQNAFFGAPGTAGTPGAGNEMLSVNGTIRTNANTYADYVFEDYFNGKSILNEDYKFKTLNEVAEFIKTNRHLPGVTSIKDVVKTPEGYSFNLTELSIQSLEKLEELYLYVIDQQKKIDDQQKQLAAKNKEVENLKISQELINQRLEKLEKLMLDKDKNK